MSAKRVRTKTGETVISNDSWRPEGAQLSTPYLTVPKPSEAIEFYRKAFGFEVGEKMDGPGGEIAHASMTFMDTHVFMLGAEGMPWVEAKSPATSGAVSPVEIYVYVPDADALAAQAQAAGAEVKQEPTEQFWGDRTAVVRDPYGYSWTLATKVGEMDESKRPTFD